MPRGAHLQVMNNLGMNYLDQKRYAEAEPMLREVYEARKQRTETLGPRHPQTLATANNLALSVAKLGRLDEAAELYETTLAFRRETLGDEHQSTLTTLNNLATLRLSPPDGGRPTRAQLLEALPRLEEAQAGYCKLMGPRHPSTVALVINLSVVLHALRTHSPEAGPTQRELFERAVAMLRTAIADYAAAEAAAATATPRQAEQADAAAGVAADLTGSVRSEASSRSRMGQLARQLHMLLCTESDLGDEAAAVAAEHGLAA